MAQGGCRFKRHAKHRQDHLFRYRDLYCPKAKRIGTLQDRAIRWALQLICPPWVESGHGFGRLSILEIDMTNLPEELYCPYCKSRNVSDTGISSRGEVADKKNTLYKCENCNRTFSEKLLRYHE